MKLLIALALVAAPLVIAFGAPTALAHNCQQATGCGPCKDGESHNHQDASGNCQSSRIPGPSPALVVVALVLSALALATWRAPVRK